MVSIKFLPPTPPWLQILLKKDFYTTQNKCRFHNAQYQTYLCKDCLGDFFCQVCANDLIHAHHHNHTIVKVVICSKQPSLNIVDFQKIWDIKDIQPYRINGKHVLYLRRSDQIAVKNHDKDQCRTCTRKLLTNTGKFKYCSINCQIKYDKYKSGAYVVVPRVAASPPPVWNTEDDQAAAVLLLNESNQKAVEVKAANGHGGARRAKKRPRWQSQSDEWWAPKRKQNHQKRRRTDALPAGTIIEAKMVVVPPVKTSRRKQSTPHRAPLM